MPALAGFLAQALATFALVGLAWFVQVVHYPLFALVGERGFAAYQAAHVRRVTWVAAPLMLVEAAGALALPLARPEFVPLAHAWVGVALVAVVWASTFLLQVPEHERLAAGFDARAASRLVATSWVRTGAWMARAALALAGLILGLS